MIVLVLSNFSKLRLHVLIFLCYGKINVKVVNVLQVFNPYHENFRLSIRVFFIVDSADSDHHCSVLVSIIFILDDY